LSILLKIAGQGSETLKLLLPQRERQAVLLLRLLRTAAPSHPQANTSNCASFQAKGAHPSYFGGREKQVIIEKKINYFSSLQRNREF